MSSAFVGGFSIHQDGENMGTRVGKGDDIQSRPPATKRQALGTITNANTRIQPRRAAKQGVTEGSCCPQQQDSLRDLVHTTNSFAIHTSQDVSMVNPFRVHIDNSSNSNSSILQPALTSLPCQAEGISIADNCLGITDSPMLLDDSSLRLHAEESDTEEERLRKVITVPEYSSDIYTYMREAELRNRPKPGYMRKQPDITTSMRSILIDWLVEVAEEYKLHRETLCLSVNYIDRFLSQMSVVRGKLQLVGAASMFLAAKYEEIYPPEVGEFVYITDDTYTKKQVLRMEHLVLKVLSFDVAVPTYNFFCEKFLKDIDATDQTSSLAMYLAELTMVESEPFLNYLPSQIAASAVCLANITLEEKNPWPQAMVESTGYCMSDLSDCIQHLYEAFCRAPYHPQQAVREKYKQDKYQQVSTLPPPPMLPQISPRVL